MAKPRSRRQWDSPNVCNVADVAVAALTTAAHDNQRYALTGPEAVTFTEMAHQLSQAVGRTITFVDVPPEAMRAALADSVAPVVRGRALKIVDEHGRVRASITVQPAETFQPTGKQYPETVILRLIDPKGRPEVKIVASEQGAGLSFLGDSDTTHVLLGADGAESVLKLTNKDGRQQLIKP